MICLIDNFQAKQYNSNMEKVYSFKIFYNNGENRVLGGRASKPEFLYGEFDGMVSWEEYDKIAASKMTVKELLACASKVFKNTFKNINRIEIINIENNEIIDFIDC